MKHDIQRILISIVLISGILPQSLPSQNDGWKLVWSDEFEYTGLPDSTKWGFNTQGNTYGWGNNELQWYTDRDIDNARVCNGILRITAQKEESNGKQYTSARLRTKDKGDWLYTKVEVRAKLPAGRGTWPAIWMLPTDSKYGGWPKCGEIDIMEHVGFSPDSVFSTVHTETYNHLKGTQVGKSIYAPLVTNQFHIYTMEWGKHQIRSYIDGIHYFTFDKRPGVDVWPFDQPFHLLLNLAIGGGLGGIKGVDDTLFPHHFDIDYVRIYQKE